MRGQACPLTEAQAQAQAQAPPHANAHCTLGINGYLAKSKLATCISLLRSYSRSKSLFLGHIVHDHIIQCGHHTEPFVATLIFQFYLGCHAFIDALQWFAQMSVRDTLSWNLAIGAYVQRGQSFEALQLYKDMQQDGSICADQVTYVHALSACTTFDEGLQVYEDIRASGFDLDTNVGTALVSMFGRLNSLQDALAVFDKIATRTVISWNALMSVHMKNGQGRKAMFFISQLQQEGVLPDKVTFINMFSAHAGHGACVSECRKLHVHALHAGAIVDNVAMTALMYAYGKCDQIYYALALLHGMDCRGLVSWNAMITISAHKGLIDNAFHMFYQMQVEGLLPDNVTFISLLDICAKQTDLPRGEKLHLRIHHCYYLKLDVVLITSLVNLYGKCGKLQEAHSLFDNLAVRNVISFNAIMTAYTQHGHGTEALKLYYRMLGEAMIPDGSTFLEALLACANKSALATGKKMHSCIVHCPFHINDDVGSALINMYGKCGDVKLAQDLFGKLQSRKTSTWNALIATYAQVGYANEASLLFGKMNCAGMCADDITFVSILAACSRGGLLEEGYYYFVCMHLICGVKQTAEHYDCMIDLLCRAGLLEYALFLLNNMPINPSIISWTSFLCAYGIGIKE